LRDSSLHEPASPDDSGIAGRRLKDHLDRRFDKIFSNPSNLRPGNCPIHQQNHRLAFVYGLGMADAANNQPWISLLFLSTHNPINLRRVVCTVRCAGNAAKIDKPTIHHAVMKFEPTSSAFDLEYSDSTK
jgi:hypothetical protein